MKTERLRFALFFLYATGLRLQEFVTASRDKLNQYEGALDEAPGWELSIAGKGNFDRDVPLTQLTWTLLDHYFRHRGFASVEDAPDGIPLIGKIMKGDVATPRPSPVASTTPLVMKGKKHSPMEVRPGISEAALYKSLKEFF